ncbi:tetratricopeptide repeat protein, partial [Streptomyces daliensis]|nr:tetratricopeptide repeat protein [Streptomyces daliensis]
MNEELRGRERDERLAAARATLRRVKTLDDFSLAATPDACAEAAGLAALLRQRPEDTEVAYRLGWLELFRALSRPWDDTRTQDELRAVARTFAPCLTAGVTDLPPQLLPHIADAAEPHVIERLRHALNSVETGPLDTVVREYRRVLDATGAGHPALPQRLANLGTALHARFERRAEGAGLDEALSALRAAVEATPEDDPDLPPRLNGLAGTLRARFERDGNLADLDAAIATNERALKATETTGTTGAASVHHPYRAMTHSNLGLAYRTRYERTTDQADLDAAIDAGRAALSATGPHEPQRPARLVNLGGALIHRHLRTGSTSDLDAGVTALREAAATRRAQQQGLAEAGERRPPDGMAVRGGRGGLPQR